MIHQYMPKIFMPKYLMTTTKASNQVYISIMHEYNGNLFKNILVFSS